MLEPGSILWDADVSEIPRRQLQACLKGWGEPATGTNVDLRSRFQVARERHRPTADTAGATTTVPRAAVARFPPRAAVSSSTQKEPAEKRLRMYRSRCPHKISTRISRARQQRLFLVQCENIPDPSSGDELKCSVVVLGSTGNIYTVLVDRIPSCTCPDHIRTQSLCKHILFVLLKVMGIDGNSHLMYQEAWLGSELKAMFEKFKIRWDQVRRNDTSIMANSKVQAQYAELKDGSVEQTQPDKSAKRKAIEANEDCPICFDPLPTDPSKTCYCKMQCGTNFHQVCIRTWLSSQKPDCQKCPLCRAEWEGDGASVLHKRKHEEGYANLGQLQGQSPLRDITSYSRTSYSRRYY